MTDKPCPHKQVSLKHFGNQATANYWSDWTCDWCGQIFTPLKDAAVEQKGSEGCS